MIYFRRGNYSAALSALSDLLSSVMTDRKYRDGLLMVSVLAVHKVGGRSKMRRAQMLGRRNVSGETLQRSLKQSQPHWVPSGKVAAPHRQVEGPGQIMQMLFMSARPERTATTRGSTPRTPRFHLEPRARGYREECHVGTAPPFRRRAISRVVVPSVPTRDARLPERLLLRDG